VADPSSESKPAAPTDASARSAGRGGLAIAVAKVSFIVFGFAQQLVLPRLLGVDGYGGVSRLLAVVSIVNNVIVASSLQGVSRTVSGAEPGHEDSAFRRVLGVHAALALAVSTIFAATAGLVADAIEAPHLATPLRLTAAVVLCYGVYAPLVGALNGKRRFVDQAGLDIFYGLSRAVLLVAGAWLFLRVFHLDGILGAAAGFVAAAMLILPIAAWRSGLGRPGPGPGAGEYLRFLGPLAFGQIGLNLLLQTDFMILSNTVGSAARTYGLSTAEADRVMGVYRGVQLFSFLPYQLLMSVQFVLFPMLARARADGDAEAVRRYTQTGVRLALVLTGLIAAPIAGLGPHVLRFAFPVEIASSGGDALRMLAPGMAAFAILGVSAAALTSLGREVASAALTWVTVALVAGACLVARPLDAFEVLARTEPGAFTSPEGPFVRLLVDRTAGAVASAMALAATVAAILLHRAAGSFARPLTLLRVLAAFAATVAVGTQLPSLPKLLVPFEALALMCVYLAVLALTRELGGADLRLVSGVFGRKRA